MTEKISIIIPVLNEADSLGQFLSALFYVLHQSQNKLFEVIVVDGGSDDQTCAVVKKLFSQNINQSQSVTLLVSQSGRARQMNVGAKYASGSILLFLHADTFLSVDAIQAMLQQLSTKQKYWGRFNVRLSGDAIMFRIIEFMINWRSCASGIATGDQAIFVSRALFDRVGGFDDIPLMEDVALSKALKKITPPLCLAEHVNTSSRRWEKYGTWRTIFLMWRLRFDYFIGVSPSVLKKKYV